MEKVLKTPGIDIRARIVTTLFGLLAFSAFAAAPTSVGDAQLAPSAKHEKIGELVTEFVAKPRVVGPQHQENDQDGTQADGDGKTGAENDSCNNGQWMHSFVSPASLSTGNWTENCRLRP